MADFRLIMIITIAVASIRYAQSDEYGCDDEYYCTKRPNKYDSYEKVFNKVLQKSKYWSGIKGGPEQSNNVGNAEPYYSGDDENCRTVSYVDTPYVIKSNNSYLVMQSKFYEQRIRVTRCLEPEASCFQAVKSPSSTLDVSCADKLGAVSLFVYNPISKKIEYRTFDIPVCCTCKMQDRLLTKK